MTKLFFFLSFLLLVAATDHAQCGKSITWSSVRTEYLDTSGAIQRTDNLPVTILTTPTRVTLSIKTTDSQSDIIEGDLENLQCNWKEAFKNGKTSFKSSLTKSNGEKKYATITIEGTEGKLAITVALENMNGTKMRILVASYKING